jgi:3-methyl-2-oxobutanoate hydroxymethyltransferase
MIHHGKAVCRGAKDAFVVVDMPFMSYQVSEEEALKNAGRLIKETGAKAVKLEGGLEIVTQIKAIVRAGIPVVAHIGLTPQFVNAFGGFKVQGKDIKTAQKVIDDAIAVQEAGAFMVVLEGVPAKLATLVSKQLSIPTIGIGAGEGCDGQVLVYHDMLSMFGDFCPKFVKRFATIGQTMKEAFEAYILEVKSGKFPAKEHIFEISEDVLNALKLKNNQEGKGGLLK